jgi:eukaryotic-like serine/threonine-protein kinase
MTTGSSLYEGLLIVDRYELKVPIGEGGVGFVWCALDHRLNVSVAIKFLKSGDEGLRRRFLEEGKIAARLASPNVVRCFDLGIYEGVPFLVLEYLQGETLRERLLVRGRLKPEDTLKVIEQVARGLSTSHEIGVVHRDIKPANLFLLGPAENPFVKILDFGAAKVSFNDWTATGGWIGTPYYVAPEQAQDASQVDSSADIWALAVVAYECLTGRKPFSGSSVAAVVASILAANPPAPTTLNNTLPSSLDGWARRVFHTDRSLRPTSAEQLVFELKEALTGAAGSSSTGFPEDATIANVSNHTFRQGPIRKPWLAWAGAMVSSGGIGYGLASRTASEMQAAKPQDAAVLQTHEMGRRALTDGAQSIGTTLDELYVRSPEITRTSLTSTEPQIPTPARPVSGSARQRARNGAGDAGAVASPDRPSPASEPESGAAAKDGSDEALWNKRL